ncbi:NHSL1 protein, partial [Sagittarius serpentarius]|nr:NHSL1 protein [Sagittarius serpentarius]
ATSNLDLESKKAAHTKLSWQQPVNVFLAAGRPPGMEQLHQEAQLNLQSLLQAPASPGGEGLARPLRRQGWGGGCLCPTLVPLVGHASFPPQPPSRRATEEEIAGTTALGARPPDASLSLPTSPDKPPAWTRAFPLPTVEEKQWHQSCSIQTNVVPTNVS